MTAVIGRTASRAAGSNQMTPAGPDQLPPVPPAVASPPPDGRLAIRRPHPPSCGPILVVTTRIAAAFYLRYLNREKCESQAGSSTRDSEHSSHNAAIGARPGQRGGGHPAAPAGRADRRPRRIGEGGQAGGADGTPVLCGTGLCDLGAHPRPGPFSGKHSERAGGARLRLG